MTIEHAFHKLEIVASRAGIIVEYGFTWAASIHRGFKMSKAPRFSVERANVTGYQYRTARCDWLTFVFAFTWRRPATRNRDDAGSHRQTYIQAGRGFGKTRFRGDKP